MAYKRHSYMTTIEGREERTAKMREQADDSEELYSRASIRKCERKPRQRIRR